MKKSWKTTAAGICGAVALIGGELRDLLDNDPATAFEISVVIAAITMLAGFFSARDNDVTSEEAGAGE